MIQDTKGRQLVYDAFVRDGYLYLVSTYYHYREGPMRIELDGVLATEVGRNEYEPVRYFRVPCSTPPTHVIIDGTRYAFPTVVEVLPVVAPSGFAIATLFKDDHAHIPEMVDWYRAQGVTHFYLYYNGPVFPAGLPQAPDITYRLWNFRYWNPGVDYRDRETGWVHAAQTAFLTAVRLRWLPQHEWFGLVDIDEAVTVVSGQRLDDFLRDVSGTYNAIRVRNHWAFRSHDRIVYTMNADSWVHRTKVFYRFTYTGLCGVHHPKEQDRCLNTENARLLHIVNWGHMNRLTNITDPKEHVMLPSPKS